MPRLIWSERSLADLERLYRFLAGKDRDAAIRAVKAIRAGVRILEHQPLMGRLAESVDGETREWLIGFGKSGYVTLYRVEGERVVLLSLRHQHEAGF